MNMQVKYPGIKPIKADEVDLQGDHECAIRHNLIYICGVFGFTRARVVHGSSVAIKRPSSSSSSTRNKARPAAITLNGSSPTTLVQLAGSARSRPFAS